MLSKSGQKVIHRLALRASKKSEARVHVSNEAMRVTLALGGYFCKDECRYSEPIKTGKGGPICGRGGR